MKVEYAPAASKQFSRLNKPIQSRIKKYMSEIALLDNPRSRGKALTSNISGLCDNKILYLFSCNKLLITFTISFLL